jgi:hypothetical protein
MVPNHHDEIKLHILNPAVYTVQAVKGTQVNADGLAQRSHNASLETANDPRRGHRDSGLCRSEWSTAVPRPFLLFLVTGFFVFNKDYRKQVWIDTVTTHRTLPLLYRNDEVNTVHLLSLLWIKGGSLSLIP